MDYGKRYHGAIWRFFSLLVFLGSTPLGYIRLAPPFGISLQVHSASLEVGRTFLMLFDGLED